MQSMPKKTRKDTFLITVYTEPFLFFVNRNNYGIVHYTLALFIVLENDKTIIHGFIDFNMLYTANLAISLLSFCVLLLAGA